ncbi:hypothetical protein MMC14_005142 [Varicellaria rhodocarpa]|nr:hypothetical protein [Varicellaria rhodocarpa]
MSSLHHCLADLVDKNECTCILQSRISFFVLHFDTTQHRDQALEKIRANQFSALGRTIPIVSAPFGLSDDSTIWVIPCSPNITQAQLAAGILETLGDGVAQMNFEIKKRLLNNIWTGHYSVRFDKKLGWDGKFLTVARTKRPITKETISCYQRFDTPAKMTWEYSVSVKKTLENRDGDVTLRAEPPPSLEKLQSTQQADATVGGETHTSRSSYSGDDEDSDDSSGSEIFSPASPLKPSGDKRKATGSGTKEVPASKKRNVSRS